MRSGIRRRHDADHGLQADNGRVVTRILTSVVRAVGCAHESGDDDGATRRQASGADPPLAGIGPTEATRQLIGLGPSWTNPVERPGKRGLGEPKRTLGLVCDLHRERHPCVILDGVMDLHPDGQLTRRVAAGG